MKSKMFRMRLSTYKKLRHYFPCKRGESAAEYFDRLVEDVIITGRELE